MPVRYEDLRSLVRSGGVYSVDDLFKVLSGVLNESQAKQLIESLALTRTGQIRAGDLITSTWANDIDHRLLDLEALTGQVVSNNRAVATFHEAWRVYGNIAKKGGFLPKTNSAEAIRSAIAITAYIQDTASAALSGEALSYVTSNVAILAAFQNMYERQHDLVVLFSSSIPGITDNSDHKYFSSLLNTKLEQDDASGGRSLKNALTSGDVDGAIAAQDRINGIVMNQGGDVTTGNLEVRYAGALGSSETLVLNSTTPIIILFEIINKTNRTLPSINFKAEFLAPKDAWSQFASVIDPISRNSLPFVSLEPFDPLKPNNPSATRQIGVAVSTPTTGVADGDRGTLQLKAFVPAPMDVRNSDVRELVVGDTATPTPPASVTYTLNSPQVAGSPTDARTNVPIAYGFTFNFNVNQGAQTRDFRCRVEISSLNTEANLFDFEFSSTDNTWSIDPVTSTEIKKVSTVFQMTNGTSRSWQITVTPSTGALLKILKFKAIVESVTDGIKAESSELSINVTH